MRRTLGSGAVVVLVLALSPAAQTADNEGVSLSTIRLQSTVQSIREVDRAPKGKNNEGDSIRVKSILRNEIPQFGRPKGAVVGSEFEVYSYLARPPQAYLKVSAKLPGGTLRAQGQVRVGRRTFSLPVVGGTGRFANRRGTRVTTGVDPYTWRDVYRLRLP